jgi:hypothetical protein
VTPDTVRGYLSAIGGRQYTMCIGAGIAFTVLLWFGKIDQGAYLGLILPTVGGYLTSTQYQKKQELKSQ